jgi:hypothetical protein
MDTTYLDYSNLLTVEELLQNGPAFTVGGIREWLFRRKKNGLIRAVVNIDKNLFIDELCWNVWLSQDKDEVSDYRDLRTRKQILDKASFKPSKLDDWLRKRFQNGLHHAIIKKGERKLYIDTRLFNRWLLEQNTNSEYMKEV